MRYYKKVLANGLRVITVPVKETKAVTVLIIFKVGSRQENRGWGGVSHFLEHLMFKGTKRRPSTLDISKALDEVGAEYNAFTTKDHTGYYIKINYERLDLALDMLSDMLQNSLFDPREIEREKGVIAEEINMYEDNPLMYVEDVFEQTVFGKDHPLGRLVIGSRASVKKLSRSQIIDYYARHYLAKRAVIVVAGPVSAEITKKVNRYFSKLKPGNIEKKLPSQKTKQPSLKINLIKKKTEQIQLCLGFPALASSDSRRYALGLLTIILGGNMSSRLFISIRERQGLAYYIRADANFYEDNGTFLIQAGLDKSRLVQAIEAILKELEAVVQKPVTQAELRKAKEFIRGKTVLELEDSSNLAVWYGRQEALEGKIITPEERYNRIKKVTRSEINKIAKQIFRQSKLNIALIGPIGDISKIRGAVRGRL
ncbi:MAG: pitrilysin family protein [Patescibacteria group bacterium]|nr:pitrilysin family protein [Patescibacteria group bacterium]